MRRTWVKVYVDQWLRGTMRDELEPDERSVWADFLALAGDSPFEGQISFTERVGYTDEQLADCLKVKITVIQSAKEKMIKYDKIKINSNNIIYIVNWNRYQSEYERLKKYRGTKISTDEGTSESTDEGIKVNIDRDIDRDKKESTLIVFNFRTRLWENITKEDLGGWKEAFPACDILRELSQMKEWLLSNPDKKKVRYRRFITNWLGRSQDKGGTKNHTPEDERRKGAIEREDEIIRLWVEEKDDSYKDLAEEILEKRKRIKSNKAEVL